MYGIIWNDDLDLEEETVYEEGKTVRIGDPAPNVMVGQAVIGPKQSGMFPRKNCPSGRESINLKYRKSNKEL